VFPALSTVSIVQSRAVTGDTNTRKNTIYKRRIIEAGTTLVIISIVEWGK
jgi:hypothetical protein